MASTNPPNNRPGGKPASPAPAKKAVAKEPTGFMNWLGRQVGHVKRAVREDPKAGPTRATRPAAPSAAGQAGPTSQAVPQPKVIYRDDKVEEQPHPTQPGVVLRRTIIDEVVVEEPKADGKGS